MVKISSDFNHCFTKDEEEKQFLLQVINEYRKEFPWNDCSHFIVESRFTLKIGEESMPKLSAEKLHVGNTPRKCYLGLNHLNKCMFKIELKKYIAYLETYMFEKQSSKKNNILIYAISNQKT